ARAPAAPPRRGEPTENRPRRYAQPALGAGPVFVAAARRGGRRDARGGRAGAAVSEPARLCALNLVPRLRPPLSMPELHGLARRAPLYSATDLPSLRLFGAGAGAVPGMPRDWRAGTVRTGGRAVAGRGRRTLPGSAHGADGQRSADGAARGGGTGRRDGRASLRCLDRDPDRREGPPFSDADPGRRGRRRSRLDRRRARGGRFRFARLSPRRAAIARPRGSRPGPGAAGDIARAAPSAVSRQSRARRQSAGGVARLARPRARLWLGAAAGRYRPLQLLVIPRAGINRPASRPRLPRTAAVGLPWFRGRGTSPRCSRARSRS